MRRGEPRPTGRAWFGGLNAALRVPGTRVGTQRGGPALALRIVRVLLPGRDVLREGPARRGGEQMPIRGLEDNAVKTSVAQLNARLADMLALKLALKQAHWNVKGIAFIAVHELLDEVAGRVEENSDTMAERVQILGGVAQGTAEVVAKKTKVTPYPTDLVSERDHVAAVCTRMADLGAALRTAITETTDAGDDGTADIFVAASRQIDKDMWFLENHLAN